MLINIIHSSGWKLFLLAELTAFFIAAAIALVPGKLPDAKGMQYLFFDEPTFFESILVYFVLTNIIISIITLVFLIYLRYYSNKIKKEN